MRRVGCIFVFFTVASFSWSSFASETQMLEAVADGKLKSQTQIALPPPPSSAPVPGGDRRPAYLENSLNRAEESDIVDRAFPVPGAKWPFNSVAVCWENPEHTRSQEHGWVRDAVLRTWQAASALKFTGWETCAANNLGIRIRVEDSLANGPHVRFLGKFLNGVQSGMVLNFTFQSWSEVCAESEMRRKNCIESIAVHEFGHAIGFAHEQNRPDTPGECRQAQGPSAGATTDITPYDPHSVMNYCNSKYNNDGKLSALDIKAVQYIYGEPR